jgi:hypothetical protein
MFFSNVESTHVQVAAESSAYVFFGHFLHEERSVAPVTEEAFPAAIFSAKQQHHQGLSICGCKEYLGL